MLHNLVELIIIHGIAMTILGLIIYSVYKRKGTLIFYWIIVALYLLFAVYIIKEFIDIPKVGEGGSWFVIEMYSMFVPGILILLCLVALLIQAFIRSLNTKK
jgi:hypothetical protein